VTAPDAPLAQRLYGARRRANLSTLETAQVAGVGEEMIVRAEAEKSVARPRHRCDRNADRPHQLISVSRRPSQLFVLPQPCRNVWHGVGASGGECCGEAEKFMHWT
jgi:hypothetical protein